MGFDTSEDLLAGLTSGACQGLVSQDPFDMGYQGVKTAVDSIKGKKVAKRVATKLFMVTEAEDNMNDPAVKDV